MRAALLLCRCCVVSVRFLFWFSVVPCMAARAFWGHPPVVSLVYKIIWPLTFLWPQLARLSGSTHQHTHPRLAHTHKPCSKNTTIQMHSLAKFLGGIDTPEYILFNRNGNPFCRKTRNLNIYYTCEFVPT